jgi:ATP/maltotriose-dependent transcriptional regulator MalT
MTVEVYLCEKFKHRHERRAFGRFLQEMLDRFGKSLDMYLVIGEPEANTASMDIIVLTHHALIVLEMKELTYAEGLDESEIYLNGSEKGGWEYSFDGGSTYSMGSVGKDRNPYQQIRDHSYKLKEWLSSHSKFLPGGPWSQDEALRRIYSWVVVSPGFNREKSHLDLPWDRIDHWFKILSIDELAWEVGIAVHPRLEFTAEHMVDLAKQLGATRRENLLEFVPNYVPPAPRLSFFSKPQIAKRIVDRDDERGQLSSALNDPLVSIISIGGPGGIGKTHLARWVASEAPRQHFNVLWVDCNEREVTQESILTAIADKMPDRYQAALIHDPDQKISDKLEAALGFLDQSPCLIVLNDYHRIQASSGLQELFTSIVHKTSNIKVLVTTRVRPEILDSPELPPGSIVELSLGGLPHDVTREYLSVENLNDAQLRDLCERTSGNPYAMALFASILRHRPLVESLRVLPLFNDERASQWANSLIETLDGEARTLASKIAVIRGPLGLDLIERLFYGSKERMYVLIRELIDHYILHEIDTNQYQMHDYIREALISKTAEKDLQKAHQNAGNYFEKLRDQTAEAGERIEAILQALYHYEAASNWSNILKLAVPVYDLLVARGDRDRSCNVAAQAVKAARVSGHNEQVVEWLIKQIKRELDLLRLDAAQKHINEATNLIPKSEQKLKAAAKPKWQSLEAQLWALQGRLYHRSREHDKIDDCFAKAVDLANQSGDRSVITDTLFRVAQIERLHGDYNNAKKHSEEAGNLAQKIGDQRLLAICISQLGMIAKDLGNYEEARRLFLLAQEKAKEAGDINGVEINMGQLGEILFRLGEYEEAERIFMMLLEKAREMRKGLSIRIELGRLIDTLIELDQLERAEELMIELKQRVEQARDEIGMAFYSKRAGQLEHKHGNVEKANELIMLGIKRLEESGNRVYIPDFERELISAPATRQFTLWDQSTGPE